MATFVIAARNRAYQRRSFSVFGRHLTVNEEEEFVIFVDYFYTIFSFYASHAVLCVMRWLHSL